MSTNVRAIKAKQPQFGEAEWQMRVDLAAAYRLADRFGFSDIIWNHITARVPGEMHHYLINSLGLRYDEITASNLLKIDLDGNVIGEGVTNRTGFMIHGAIHAARPDVVCIMHSHSQGGLGVSCLEEGLLPLIQDSLSFFEKIAYHDYEGLSVDPAECPRLAQHLGDAKVMIMRNHGLLTVGRTIAEAFILMYSLERACRAQMQVLATGRPIRLIPAHIRTVAAAQYAEFAPGEYEWPALLRLLDKTDPSYKT
ncbi:MAG: class II aldolase/adducin family protein [Alphaproteobacteria bacterium]|nr:class II aldolase/adducin family protein [Alphaproteobacteria bacterium]